MLKNKIALITGSTSGIGLGILKRLAAQGYHVTMNGFGIPSEIEEQREKIEKDFGVRALYHNADMTHPDQIAHLIQTIQKEFGGLDILVNNAGIQHVAPITDFPSEKWDQILAINLSSAFHTIRHTLPLMMSKHWGRIVNIASAHALVASPFKAAYVAAKHGLAGLTKVVALETAQKGITCNALCPGYVQTPLVENQISDTARARGISEQEVIQNVMLGEQPTKKFVTIEEIASFVLFLCSNAADSMTGGVFPMDGGWTAH